MFVDIKCYLSLFQGAKSYRLAYDKTYTKSLIELASAYVIVIVSNIEPGYTS